jgi:hypothetical protein
MASTYSALKIELIATGEQSGTWGTTTNNNLGDAALGEAITGSADVAFSSADVTVTLTDSNASQAARNLRLNLTGTSGGARQLILGSGCQIEKLYLINNGLADAVTVKNTGGTGITVPAGKSTFVFNNGTNVVEAANFFPGTASSGANSDITSLSGLTTPLSIAQGGTGTSSTTFTNLTTNVTGTLPIANGGTGTTSTTFTNLTTNVTGTLPIANGGTGSTSTTFVNAATNITGTLPVANGGTGASTLTSANVILGAGTSAVTFVAPGSSGNVLTSNGSTWTSAAAAAGGFSNMTVFASPGTFTTPSTTTKIKITLTGGGGSGAVGRNLSPGTANSSAGAGGGYAVYVGPVSASTPYAVTVGSGGASVGPGVASGNPGGTSSFGAVVSATGGGGGIATPTAAAAPGAIGGSSAGATFTLNGGNSNPGGISSGNYGTSFFNTTTIGNAPAVKGYGFGTSSTAGALSAIGGPGVVIVEF